MIALRATPVALRATPVAHTSMITRYPTKCAKISLIESYGSPYRFPTFSKCKSSDLVFVTYSSGRVGVVNDSIPKRAILYVCSFQIKHAFKANK